MEQQGQNGRREMYILSLDNNRIFWILSIALLVLVFLFLLGYWIGHDNTAPAGNDYRPASGVRNGDQLTSLKKMLDDRNLSGTTPPPGNGGVDGTQSRSGGDGTLAGGSDTKTDPASGTPPLKTDGLTKQEKKELDALKQGAAPPKTVPDKVKTAPVRRPARRTVARRAPAKRTTGTYVSGGKYAIQVASLANAGSANRLKSQLAGRRYRAFVSRAVINGKSYYRIKVGRFSTYASARRVLASLKQTSYGRGSYIVTN